MDIKRRRREAGLERQQVWDNYPGHPPGSYAQGSAASDENNFWFVRAQSWSMGADVHSYRAIEQENEGEHDRWGTPWRDQMPAPNEAWPEASSAGTASRNADDPLPNPHNYHSNPGYMATSTGSALQASQPGGMYRTAGPVGPHAGHRPMPHGGPQRQRVPGKTVVPAGPGRQPESEGGPLVVSTGFPGR